MLLPRRVGLRHCSFQGFTLTFSVKPLNSLVLPLQQYALSWATYLSRWSCGHLFHWTATSPWLCECYREFSITLELRSSCGHLFHWTVPSPWLCECYRELSITLIGKKRCVCPTVISVTSCGLLFHSTFLSVEFLSLRFIEISLLGWLARKYMSRASCGHLFHCTFLSRQCTSN
jgi:hypothetical protein